MQKKNKKPKDKAEGKNKSKGMKISLEEVCARILKKYMSYIKSIALEGGLLLFLVSDKKQEIRRYASKFNFPVRVELAENYLKNVFSGEEMVYERLGSSSILYDPEHLIDPIKEMIISGKIHGTKESLAGRFIGIGENFRKIDMIKHKILDNIYTAVVELSQALLIKKQDVTCNPKEVPKNIKKYLVDKRILEKRYLEIAAEIIAVYKDIEHRKRPAITGLEMDSLQKKAEDFQGRVMELLEKKR